VPFPGYIRIMYFQRTFWTEHLTGTETASAFGNCFRIHRSFIDMFITCFTKPPNFSFGPSKNVLWAECAILGRMPLLSYVGAYRPKSCDYAVGINRRQTTLVKNTKWARRIVRSSHLNRALPYVFPSLRTLPPLLFFTCPLLCRTMFEFTV